MLEKDLFGQYFDIYVYSVCGYVAGSQGVSHLDFEPLEKVNSVPTVQTWGRQKTTKSIQDYWPTL